MDGLNDRINSVPMRRPTQILTRSKTSDNELKQTTFPTKNARLPSKSAVFANEAPTMVGGLQGVVTGTLTY